jgi:c-di-GMP-binding flagellar brake protein YcgR
LKKAGSKEIISAYTENIGCGGICVILEKDIGLFSPVNVELDLENGLGWINSDATVVWVVKRDEKGEEKSGVFDTGIEFNNLKEEDRQRIEKMINNILVKAKK